MKENISTNNNKEQELHDLLNRMEAAYIEENAFWFGIKGITDKLYRLSIDCLAEGCNYISFTRGCGTIPEAISQLFSRMNIFGIDENAFYFSVEGIADKQYSLAIEEDCVVIEDNTHSFYRKIYPSAEQ